MSVHQCRECGKAHAPRCDKCGSTRDLRSYHGPCGKCAFPEKQKQAMYDAFADEMEKISAAGFAHNLGSRIVASVGKRMKGVGQWAAKQPGNIMEAGLAHARPIHGMKEGWRYSWDPTTGGGNLGRAMFLGGTALSGASIIPKNDPMGQGESRLTRTARFLGGTATGLIAAKHGVLPSILYGIGGDVAGGYVGRAIDRKRGYKPPVKPAPAAPAPQPLPAEQGT